MAYDLALDPSNLEEDNSELDSASAKKAAARQFKQITNKAKDQAKKAFQKAAQKVASKAVARGAAISAGATGVGLLVTYIIWTGQAIIANWLGKDKVIPKLEWWELILWAILGLLLLALLLLVITALAAAFAITNPIVGAKIVGSFIWDWVTN